MNILQGISSRALSVSLNPPWTGGRESKVLRRFVYHHPVLFNQAHRRPAAAGRDSGHQRTHFCRGFGWAKWFSRGTGAQRPGRGQTSGRAMRRRRGPMQGDEGMGGGISAIWQGSVRHRRFAPGPRFSYSLFMLGLDLDELPGFEQGRWFAVERADCSTRRSEDYLQGSEGPSSRRSGTRWRPWGCGARRAGAAPRQRALPGFYFSPVNFYFCDPGRRRPYLLAEVSNTPGTSATTTCWIWRRSPP